MAQGLYRMKQRGQQIKREADVVILPITGGVDVFTGKGWDSWTRFDTTGGFPRKIFGPILNDEDYQVVFKSVTRRAA